MLYTNTQSLYFYSFLIFYTDKKCIHTYTHTCDQYAVEKIYVYTYA